MRIISAAALIGFAFLSQPMIFGQDSSPTPAPAVKAQATTGSPDARADALLKQLTPEEKIQLLSGGANGFSTHAIERLGIGSFAMSDGPQGVRNGPGNPTPPACAFPCGAALAATWDVDLAAAYGQAMGLEGRARGTSFQLGPGLNICRVPVNGRNFEYFGEDPFLSSMIAVNWVKNCAAQGVVPTIKHFAANNQEDNRNSVDAVVDERTLHEIYLPAFKLAATEGGNIAVMCSYNRLNGSYASNNDWLLNQTLKKLWGFPGLVMSDWGASHQVSDLAKGLDLEMPSGRNLNAQNIQAALADGTLKQSDIDNAVHRILRTEAAAGWFDAGWQQKKSDLPLDSPDSAKTALAVAEASIVLLKNERQALPFDRAKIKSLVVLGPNASAVTSATLPINIGGGGSGAVTPFANRFAEADYLQGIIKAAGSQVKVTYLSMPTEPGPEVYATLANARTAEGGEAGLTLSVEVTGAGDSVQIAPTVQKGVNATWQPGQLPFGVPAGRNATFTWKGVLVAPQDGDWQLRATGGAQVTIAGTAVADGAITHLIKDKPASIVIEAQAQANPPAGRGQRGGAAGGGRGGRRGGPGGGPAIRVALLPPAIPDLASVHSADAVVVCVGLNRNVEAEGRDRPFDLPAIQQYLIAKVSALNRRTVVVNNSGAAVGMAAWEKNPAAILQAWYLGQEGGIAIGRVLFGDVNPSGRLCSTFDRTFEENPAFAYYPGKTPPNAEANYPVEPYTEGIFYGYRGYDKAGKDPLYAFGYGLSYTTFAWSSLKTEKAASGVKVSLDVRNTGRLAGAEVVQVYVAEQNCPLPRPRRELKGFAKVLLKPGETRRVEILLPAAAFAYWSPEKKDWTTDLGNEFNVEAGASERDIKLKEMVRLR